MSAPFEACGGCGAETPSERCIGCLHDFGSGPITPSNANTSGLEVVAWRFKFAASNSWAYQPGPPAPEWEDDCRDVQSLVTAASAQARIAELEADLSKVIAQRDSHWDEYIAERQSRMEHGVREAGYLDVIPKLTNRATAAEARADRLAKALERAADDLRDIGTQKPQPTNSPDPEHENYLRRVLISLGQVGNTRARAALQQETQK